MGKSNDPTKGRKEPKRLRRKTDDRMTTTRDIVRAGSAFARSSKANSNAKRINAA
jgi:hypothetical protein